LMQFGLDLQYPRLGFFKRRPRCVGVHRRPPGIPIPALRVRWVPSPCSRLSRPRTTTDPPPHRLAVSRRHVFPPSPWMGRGSGSQAVVPTFTMYRLTGGVPSFSPAVSPRLRRRHSPWPPG
jgi:hypothetical protein